MPRPSTILARFLCAAALVCAPCGSPSMAAAAPAPAVPAAPAPTPDTPTSLLPADSITHHTLVLHGRHIAYTAQAGTLTLRDEAGKPAAKMFYVAYRCDAIDGHGGASCLGTDGRRPVSFFFNGGPGAGTAFLNLGAAGPAVLDFPTADPTDGGGARLRDNPDSWLGATDMVFLDAVGTGYSRALDDKTAPKAFYGVKQDAAAFAKAIALWVAQNGRAGSPHYLVGESYGGIRSMQVAWALQTQQSLIPDGIVMISPAIEMGLLDVTDNPLGAALSLPGLINAQLEREHRLSPASINEGYDFALGPYLSTLAASIPTGEKAGAFYADIARRTGLPVATVTKLRGVLDVSAHDVRSRDGRLYSTYDATQSIADPYPEGVDNADSPDPVLWGYGRAYGAAFAGYAADTLGFRTDLTYDLLNLKVNGAWDYRDGEGGLEARQIPLLRKLLALDPGLHVFVANGLFDMSCPFASTRWMIAHLPVGADRVGAYLYAGGHMLYSRPDSRAALTRDVAAFMAPASDGDAHPHPTHG
ncbi:peptidase S10 [Ameyamaea chiangmaiensis]|uniref:Peptidase S10 n=2 Tax=Ameyamaea chiangmaiensis TaxID=442969 RepID=A0A850P8M4_9PROT|nr:peptidase S10 [Ameyamaea chiangmaiensis]MBS4075685.1 peptidase S10 [Ameyamaea chiangmaiensis]NVN40258.1 peptidase S10 [Ameyamaea chiangmaiensis]